MTPNLKVLGIDPSITNLGISIIDGDLNILMASRISTSPKNKIEFRLKELVDGIKKIVDKFGVDYIAMESSFFNPKTARGCIPLFQLMGTLIYSMYDSYSKPIELIAPKRMKKLITGSGNSNKEEVQESLFKYFGESLRPFMGKFDITDSLGVSLAFLMSRRDSLDKRPTK